MRLWEIVCISVILFWVITIALVFSSHAQRTSSAQKKDKMVVSGDEGFFKKGYARFTGNAYAEKGSIRMSADVIEYFETNNLAIGRGGVVLKDSKTGLTVVGGYSRYYGESNVVVFSGKPWLAAPENNFFLRGELLTIYQDEEYVVSETNSYLSNSRMEVYSDVIEILSKSNLTRLVGNARVVLSNVTITSDRALIITESNRSSREMEVKRFIGIGNVTIYSSNSLLKCSSVVINFTNNEVYDYIAVGGVRISNENTLIFSEYFRSEFYRNEDIIHIGMTNVVMSNLGNDEVVYSDYLFSDRRNGYELLTGNVVYVVNRGEVRIMAQVVERFLREGFSLLRKSVVLETEGVRIVSEIARYDERMKILYMVGNPRVVSEDRLGVSANTIVIDVEKKSARIENGSYGYVIPGM